MSERPMEGMSDALAGQLRAALRGEPPVPWSAQQKLRARLGPDLLASSVVGAALGAAATTSWSTSAMRALVRVWKLGAVKASIAAVAAYGAGYATHAVSASHTKPMVVYVDRVAVAPSVSSAPVPAVASGAPVFTPESLPSASAQVVATSAQHNSPDARLSEELLQLEAARAALARRDARATLVAVERYEARFPQGQLREEAEVIAIQALARAGQKSDARARAALYRSRYPHGFFGGSVAEAIREPD